MADAMAPGKEAPFTSPISNEQDANDVFFPQDRNKISLTPLLDLSTKSVKGTTHTNYDTETTQASPGEVKAEISVADPVQAIVPQIPNLTGSDDSEEAALQRAAAAANWGSHPFKSAGSSTSE
jgi:hypothetical protein